MKKSAFFYGLVVLGVGAFAAAQSPEQSTQTRPDAVYPKPSGQDSNPSKTQVRPTETPKGAKTDKTERRHTVDSLRKAAAPSGVYSGAVGKKADASGGCSTPTDAQSAGVQRSQKEVSGGKANEKIVCTTSGGESTTKPN